jgi:hypothetical protein
MKKCPVNESCIGFDNFAEIAEAFKKMAEAKGEAFNDDLSVEGNSGLQFSDVKAWANVFGAKNIYFEDTFQHGYIATFYFDLRKAVLYMADGFAADFSRADEVSVKNGFLRVWFD